MKPRVYITIFVLTFIVAFSPFLTGNSGAYYTAAVDTAEVIITVDGQSIQEQTIVDGLTTSSAKTGSEERTIIEEQVPLAEPNTQRVGDGVFWVVLALALLLFGLFAFLSYRRIMLPKASTASDTPKDGD